MTIKTLIISLIATFFVASISLYFIFSPSNGIPKSCDELDLTDINIRIELASKGKEAREFIMQCDHFNATTVRPITGSDSKLNLK